MEVLGADEVMSVPQKHKGLDYCVVLTLALMLLR
jgi:hypothetical protein